MSRLTFPTSIPTLLGTITTPKGLALLSHGNLPSPAVEVRVDALLAKKVSPEKIIAALEKRRVPVLLTLRIPAEGGHYPWKLSERRQLFLQLLPYVEAIDLELATASALKDVLAEATRLKKTIVLSAHALKKPAAAPHYALWLKQFRLLSRKRNTILKVASQVVHWRDLQRLAALLINHPELAVAVMGLGPQGGASRQVLCALGSRLVYGYLDQSAAPGQPSAADLKKRLNL